MTFLVIYVGGGIGATVRYLIGAAFPTNAFPTTTLFINIVGCLLLGILVAIVNARPAIHPLIRPALGTGILGGFTTFSTFAFETQNLAAVTAGLYIATSVIGGVAAAGLGYRVGHFIDRAERRVAIADADIDIDPDLP